MTDSGRPIYAIDFETYYEDGYSLQGKPNVPGLHPWVYVNSPKFDAYLMGAVGPDGYQWVGNPKDMEWRRLHGARVCAHNATFEQLIFERLQKEGIIPRDVKVAEWIDTADMAAYLGTQRNLEDATKYLLNRILSKSMRTKMRGKTWADAVAKGWDKQLMEYCLNDTVSCYLLWREHGHEWPECEREFSRRTRESCFRGIYIDVPLMNKAISTLGTQLSEAEREIPWTDDDKPLSPTAIRRQASQDGAIPVPASFSAQSPELLAWEDKHAPRLPWVKAIRVYRRVNSLFKKVETLRDGLRPDGTFMPLVKYYGAATGRDSGGNDEDTGGRFNIKNPPKYTMFGVDIRPLILPPPGHLFIIGDWSQIEFRMLLWRVKDTSMLDLIRSGLSPYQAHAQLTMGYKGADLKTDDPHMYHRAKGRCLGLGYQCGSKRYSALAASWGMPISLEQSETEVNDFRAKNQKIVAHWQNHNAAFGYSVHHGDPTHRIELASGRWLTYHQPHLSQFGMAAYPFRGGPARHYYGGKLTENEIQATARDVLRDSVLAIMNAGIWVPFTLYDEVVAWAPEAEAAGVQEAMNDMMCNTVKWMPGCPLDAEFKITPHYMKD